MSLMREKEIPPFYMSGAATLKNNGGHFEKNAANLKKCGSHFVFENVKCDFLYQKNPRKVLLDKSLMREKEIPTFYMPWGSHFENGSHLKKIGSHFEFKNIKFGFFYQKNLKKC